MLYRFILTQPPVNLNQPDIFLFILRFFLISSDILFKDFSKPLFKSSQRKINSLFSSSYFSIISYSHKRAFGSCKASEKITLNFAPANLFQLFSSQYLPLNRLFYLSRKNILLRYDCCDLIEPIFVCHLISSLQVKYLQV